MGVLTFCVMRRVLGGSTWYDGKDKQKKYTKQNTFYVSMTHKGNACVLGLCRRRTACLPFFYKFYCGPISQLALKRSVVYRWFNCRVYSQQ